MSNPLPRCTSIEGWPRLEFVVRGQDKHGRNQVAGYGSVLVPTTPGTHEVRGTNYTVENVGAMHLENTKNEMAQ
jgi:hypothetical protein